MSNYVNENVLRNATWAALMFAIVFSVVAAAMLLLVVAIPIAVTERLSFGAVAAAASAGQWTVYWFLTQVHKPPRPESRPRH